MSKICRETAGTVTKCRTSLHRTELLFETHGGEGGRFLKQAVVHTGGYVFENVSLELKKIARSEHEKNFN